MGIVMRARSPRDVDRLPSLRGRGALPVLLSRRRRHVLTLTLGRFFSGLKRLRIFGERRSLLEISRRREEHFPPPRVQVSDSSIVIMVASRREMYMYSKKKKNPPFFIRGVRSRGTVSIIITRSETEERLASLSARFERHTTERTQPRRRRQPPSREGPRELDLRGRERGGSAARGSDCRGLKGPIYSVLWEHEEEKKTENSPCVRKHSNHDEGKQVLVQERAPAG